MVKYTPDGRGSYLTNEWQDAVDNIYRCMKSNLLSVDNDSFFKEYGTLVEALRRNSPFRSGDGQLLWNGTFLSPTSTLLQLVGRYLSTTGIRVDIVNTEFIAELERIFADSGVPWSSEPLVPLIVVDR
jgi:hypothetical protein